MLNKSGRKDVEEMLIRQLGHLSNSGVNFSDAVTKLKSVADGHLEREVEALSKHLGQEDVEPRQSRRYSSPIAMLGKLGQVASENGGRIESIFGSANEIFGPLSESYRIYWSGISAFIWYAGTLALMMTVVFSIYSIFVFPQFEQIFSEFDADMPGLTSSMMRAFDVLGGVFAPGMLAVVVGMFVVAYKMRFAMMRLEPLRGVMTRVPGLSALCRSYNRVLLINFSRLLACSGVDAVVAVNAAWNIMKNKDSFAEVADSNRTKLSSVVRNDPVLGALIVARETDTLESEIKHLSLMSESIYADQLSRVREEFTLGAQIIIGVIIATLVISMYLPMFKLGEVY